MNYSYKVTSKYFLASTLVALVLVITLQSKSIGVPKFFFHTFLTAADTPPQPRKANNLLRIQNLIREDSIKKANSRNITPTGKDSNVVMVKDTFDLKLSKDSIDAPMDYAAEDSMVLDVPTKKITLYGKKAKAVYKNDELTAPVIQLDQQTGIISASLKRDSTGKVISFPTFKQTDMTTVSDSIKFNLKSGKGITKSSYTQQGEIFVYGEVIKKVSDNVFYAKRGRFTTCDLDTPHFAFVSAKMKFITNQWAYSGPVHPEFEGVPIPIYFPWGIYPLTQGRHSGFLAPQFTSNQQLGLGLEGLGYYKILGPYWDLIARTNIYSYGGWSLDLNPRYMKRYHYSGNLEFQAQHFNYNFKGDPDFQKNQSYHLLWTHTADSKARPGVTFSAYVNAGSSSFNSFVPNDPVKNFTNQLYSSIQYSKTWKDKPFNLTVAANHNQNTTLKLINVNLPDVGFTVNTLYPFRKKEFIGTPKWFENIGIAYSGNVKSLFSFYDTAPHIFQHIADTLQWGAHHSFPISISLPQLGAFQVAPQISYDETWYQRKSFLKWDSAQKKLDTSYQKGFYTARQMSFGLGISTRIFGLYTARRKDAKVLAIRHEIRPSISANYIPDMNKRNYYYAQVDSIGDKLLFPVFAGNIFSPYGSGKFGGLSFGIDNNLQMKVRNKKDTGDNAFKKITLIDGLSLNGSYNFLQDSFQLSTLSVSMRSTLFEKVAITAGAILDPYDVNNDGQRLKTLLWKRKPFTLGRFQSGNLSMSSQFQGGNKGGGIKAQTRSVQSPAQFGYSNDDYNSELAYIRNNPGDFADFNIPWSLSASYSLTMDRSFRDSITAFPAKKGFHTTITHSTTFSGTLNLTPKWQVASNGTYNFSTGQLGYITLGLSRDLHCWQMSINISPIGDHKFYSIYLSPKSGLLRDLKINRTRSFNSSF